MRQDIGDTGESSIDLGRYLVEQHLRGKAHQLVRSSPLRMGCITSGCTSSPAATDVKATRGMSHGRERPHRAGPSHLQRPCPMQTRSSAYEALAVRSAASASPARRTSLRTSMRSRTAVSSSCPRRSTTSSSRPPRPAPSATAPWSAELPSRQSGPPQSSVDHQKAREVGNIGVGLPQIAMRYESEGTANSALTTPGP